MKTSRFVALGTAVMLTGGIIAGCGSQQPANNAEGQTQSNNGPFRITIGTSQVGEVPADGNEVEKAIEQYTNTDLDIQWIPNAAYDEKVNVMIASNEMPMMLRVKYVPTTISAIQSGLFWEVGPYLSEYKNLAAQNEQYYENITVDGKVYGIPLFRDISRSATIYRKDWFDALNLKPPTNVDEWYAAFKAIATQDPDQNGQDDTYGMILDKKYNEGTAAMTTRFAVSLGAPNKWGVDGNGKFTPEFLTQPYKDVMDLFRRAYAEKLINQDFAVLDTSEVEKMYDAGRAGIRIAVSQNAKSMQDRLVKSNPNGQFDVVPMTGPNGVRVAGEVGNNGFYVFPKSAVKTEEDLKKILTFIDKMFEEPMATLQRRGIENKHFKFVENGAKTEFVDFSLFQREVKPYRDDLFNVEGYNVKPLKDTPIGEKSEQIPKDSLQYAVSNPALTLNSAIYSERGRELEQMIYDAQTKYIMGQIDEAGWQQEIEKWRKAGGDQMIQEYEESYAQLKK